MVRNNNTFAQQKDERLFTGGRPENRMSISFNIPSFCLTEKGKRGDRRDTRKGTEVLAGKAGLEGQGEVLDSGQALPGEEGLGRREMQAQ